LINAAPSGTTLPHPTTQLRSSINIAVDLTTPNAAASLRLQQREIVTGRIKTVTTNSGCLSPQQTGNKELLDRNSEAGGSKPLDEMEESALGHLIEDSLE